MNYEVGFTRGALEDVREAQAWYEQKVGGLGGRFSESVNRQARSLEKLPTKYREVAAGI